MKTIATILMAFFLFTFIPTQSLAKECSENGNTYSCTFDDGSSFSTCSPWLDKYEMQACQYNREQQTRAKRFYKKDYDRNCRNSIGKNTEYCRDLNDLWRSH